MDVCEIQIVPIRIQISLFVFDFNVDIKWVYLNLISDRYLKNMEYSILSISARKLISMSNGVMVIKWRYFSYTKKSDANFYINNKVIMCIV
jgi:hypothetical protein